MNQPHSKPLVAFAARAATRRTVAVVVLVLLALLGTPFGSGVAAAGGATTSAPASVPSDPAGGDQPEEADTDVSPSGPVRARPAARYVAPDTHTDPATAEPVPYRPGRSRLAELALPLRAVRCVVLRC
ncbi:hypothetical protein ACH492_02725 [Streptomyces sp. NPDC019443]|uniref:hypothetical protein n=1 Tax=Streptomyces sp. NPDC019443 TaxID=3365061 RepID=UPI0037BDFDB8